MLKKHKNKIFESLTLSKVITLDQVIGTTHIENGEEIFVIEIKNTPLHFVISNAESGFITFYYIQTEFRPQYPESDWLRADGIEGLCLALNNWINYVVKEYMEDQNTPDLWELFEKYNFYFSSKNFSKEDFQFFSQQEKDQVIASVDQFKLY
jgi:hypothetical protein